eukprot:5233824-Ditylum_brightwellii.AAC.1
MISSENSIHIVNGATTTGLESNQVIASNFLQLENGYYIARNASFNMLPNTANKMFVQLYQQKLQLKGFVWVDCGINVSAMERCFCMIEETGLPKCVDQRNIFELVLLGLHEFPFLENNDALLLLTNQAHEVDIVRI